MVAFIALLMTTTALFIRPGELSPALLQLYLYEVSILLTLLFGYQTILAQFTGASLSRSPQTSCLLWFLLSMMISYFAHGMISEGIDMMVEMFKMSLYYFLLVGILDNKEKLIGYLKWSSMTACGAMLIAFLHLWKYIDIPGQENAIEAGLERMGGTGLFKDPNECSALAATFVPICMYFAFRKGTSLLWRAWWLGMCVFLFQAIQATYSRGGLVALGAGIVGVVFGKFGRKGLFMLPLLPVGLMFVGSRQGEISVTSGTGQQRIVIQHAGVVAFIHSPIIGVGPGHYNDIAGFVAHNSFLQPYTENGFLGGASFLTAYVLSFYLLARVGGRKHPIVDPELAEIRPYLIGMMTCQVAAKMSLSQNFQLQTYLFWGVVLAYLNLCETIPPIERLIKYPLLGWFLGVGVAGVIFFYFYVMLLVRF